MGQKRLICWFFASYTFGKDKLFQLLSDFLFIPHQTLRNPLYERAIKNGSIFKQCVIVFMWPWIFFF